MAKKKVTKELGEPQKGIPLEEPFLGEDTQESIPPEERTHEARRLRDRALMLRRRLHSTSLELATVLHRIYHADLWTEMGHDSFMEFTEGELEIGYRSCMYSIRIVDAMNRYGISLARARQIGWGRLRVLLPHLTEHGASDLLTRAERMSVRELENSLRSSTGQAQEEHKVSLLCTSAEASVIYDAIDYAKRRLDTQSSSSAMEYICQEWMIANEGEVNQVALPELIEFARKNYGVRLVQEGQPDIEEMLEGSG